MKWPATIVAYLLGLRAAGLADFDEAWAQAELAVPPPDRLAHEPEPTCIAFAVFFREACRREWLGLARADYAALRELLEPGGDGRPAHRTASLHAGRHVLIA